MILFQRMIRAVNLSSLVVVEKRILASSLFQIWEAAEEAVAEDSDWKTTRLLRPCHALVSGEVVEVVVFVVQYYYY